ncbi:hypothetical protein [Flavobacterium sp. F52]|uniref:hypothetical protein n=1 Tax=Flavobacterium sp. F52 TaxID=1202532 RepID=UPI000272F28A|nr:hypothetical protein [Flavobacterium sp. F52]EJG03347.1 hypothetical protein FF52_01520 [Flavobacterium sp. F52]
MSIYCTEDFIKEFKNIIKKKQYKDFENLFHAFFLPSNIANIGTGDRLFGPTTIPYLKKRIPDSSGYRFYYLLEFSTGKVILNFAHAKRPPLGFENISTRKKKELHDAALVSRSTSEGLFTFAWDPINQKTIFTPVSKY